MNLGINYLRPQLKAGAPSLWAAFLAARSPRGSSAWSRDHHGAAGRGGADSLPPLAARRCAARRGAVPEPAAAALARPAS